MSAPPAFGGRAFKDLPRSIVMMLSLNDLKQGREQLLRSMEADTPSTLAAARWTRDELIIRVEHGAGEEAERLRDEFEQLSREARALSSANQQPAPAAARPACWLDPPSKPPDYRSAVAWCKTEAACDERDVETKAVEDALDEEHDPNRRPELIARHRKLTEDPNHPDLALAEAQRTFQARFAPVAVIARAPIAYTTRDRRPCARPRGAGRPRARRSGTCRSSGQSPGDPDLPPAAPVDQGRSDDFRPAAIAVICARLLAQTLETIDLAHPLALVVIDELEYLLRIALERGTP